MRHKWQIKWNEHIFDICLCGELVSASFRRDLSNTDFFHGFARFLIMKTSSYAVRWLYNSIVWEKKKILCTGYCYIATTVQGAVVVFCCHFIWIFLCSYYTLSCNWHCVYALMSPGSPFSNIAIVLRWNCKNSKQKKHSWKTLASIQ